MLNVGTGFFWGSRPSIAELLAYLESGDADGGPAARLGGRPLRRVSRDAARSRAERS